MNLKKAGKVLAFLCLVSGPVLWLPLHSQKIIIRKEEKQANRKALTWCVLKKWENLVQVGVHEQSDPYVGDTGVQESLPILAIKKGGLPLPQGFPETISATNGWASAKVAKTEPVKGSEIESLEHANILCREQLGDGWRMAEFHDGQSSWRFWAVAQGEFEPGERFWISINDQQANPWDLERSAKAVALSNIKEVKPRKNKYFEDDKKNEIQEGLVRSVTDSNRPGVKYYLGQGADANLPIDGNDTVPLMIVVDYFCQKYLLEAGALTEASDKDGRTALFFRVRERDPFMLDALLKAGAELNHRDNSGQTPVFWTVKYDKTNFFKKLLKLGADIGVIDNSGISLLQYAIQLSRTGMIKMLLDSALSEDRSVLGGALIAAAREGNAGIVKLLLSAGADREFQDKEGNDAMWHARQRQHLDVIDILDSK